MYNLSNIFKTAWALIRKGLASNLSEALKIAWRKYRFVNKLVSGIVTFSYLKKNNTVREAVGTLKSVPYTDNSKPVNHLITYFDLEANGWRSFFASNLISNV